MEKAIVARVYVNEHPNADRLLVGDVKGFTVVVSKETEDGQLGVFFPSDLSLSDEFCVANNLYPVYDSLGHRIGGGFIDPKNRRVRAQNFRGVKSEGLWVPLTYFNYFLTKSQQHINAYYDLQKTEGFQFSELAGDIICEKWLNPETLKVIRANQKAGIKQAKETRFLPMHPDTVQLKYYIDKLPIGAKITFTEKLHGTCCFSSTKIYLWGTDKPRSIKDIEVGDIVVGYDSSGVLVPSLVTDTFSYPLSDNWLKLYFNQCGNYKLGLTCTKDHLIYTKNRGYVEAKDLITGDSVVSIKYQLLPDSQTLSILTGKLLGDGYLDTSNPGYSITFGHKVEHEEYVDYCMDLLGDFCTQNKRYRISGYGTEMVDARTKGSRHLNTLFNNWKITETKQVPANIKLDPISLAFWYMDDGSLLHTLLQQDRACFATCAFTEESVDILINALADLNLEAVSYKDNKGYWRIRLNYKAADKLFAMISPYIPPVMQYKLPDKYRVGENYVKLQSYQAKVQPIEVNCVFDHFIQDKPHVRYDLTTTTSNFIAQKVLVHNSQRSGWSLETVRKPYINLPWIKDVFYREVQEWVWRSGTRRVLVNSFSDERHNCFYQNEEFRSVHEETLKKCLPKGISVYYEVVGYTTDGKPIMPTVHTKELGDKEFTKQYGDTITYSYGCRPYESKMFIYNIIFTTEDGEQYNFSWEQIKAFCKKHFLEHVPELVTKPLYGTEFNRNYYIRDLADRLSHGESLLDSRHIREGVCLMIEHEGDVTFVKNKSAEFYILEGVSKASGSIDIEEKESYTEV